MPLVNQSHRPRRRAALVAGAAAAVVPPVAFDASSAGAYPIEPTDCVPRAKYSLNFASGMDPTTEITPITNGIQQWLEARDAEGGFWFDIVPVGTPGAWEIDILWHDYDDDRYAAANALSGCDRIRFNSDYRSDPDTVPDSYDDNEDLLQSVAAHEFGHLLGLHHTGHDDADGGAQNYWGEGDSIHDGLKPVMSTCFDGGWDDFDDMLNLSTDDVASVDHQWRTGATNPPVTANLSFESGIDHWSAYNTVGGASGSFLSSTYNPLLGDKVAWFSANSVNRFVHTNAAVNAHDDNEVEPLVYMRSGQSDITIWIHMAYRPVFYNGSADCDYQDIGGRHQNFRWDSWPAYVWTIHDSNKKGVGSSWDAISYLPADDELVLNNSFDAYDLELRIWLYHTATYAKGVYLDNAEIVLYDT